MKGHYQRFKSNAQDCLHEFSHYSLIECVAKALNSHLGSSQYQQIAGPSENLKLQLQSLEEMSEEILKSYSEGIHKLKSYELHPKLQSEGKKYLIDIYYKEEQMNQFRDSLKRQLDKMKARIEVFMKNST